MAKKTKIVMDHAGVRALLHDPGVVAELNRQAVPILAAAKQIAKAEAYDTGDYYDGLAIEDASGAARARVHVVAADKKSHIVESRVGVLARAAASVGAK